MAILFIRKRKQVVNGDFFQWSKKSSVRKSQKIEFALWIANLIINEWKLKTEIGLWINSIKKWKID